MKRRLVVLAGLVLLAGCESERTMPDGKSERCIGLNRDPNPSVKYEWSARNIVWAIVGAEFVVPPVIVVLNEYKCPVTP